jgi:pentatricopeptide repeat protein
MKRSKVRPDALTYSILISGFLQNGDLRYAMEWYYKMMDGGYRPASFIINNLMAALHASGQGRQVLTMWRETGRLGLSRDEQTYEIVIESCKKYNLDEAHAEIQEELRTFLADRYFKQKARRDSKIAPDS